MSEETLPPPIVGHSKLTGIPYMASSYSPAVAEQWQVMMPLDRFDEGTISEIQRAVGDLHAQTREQVAGVPPVGSTHVELPEV